MTYIVPPNYMTQREKLQYTKTQADYYPPPTHQHPPSSPPLTHTQTHTPSMAFKFYINKNVAMWAFVLVAGVSTNDT